MLCTCPLPSFGSKSSVTLKLDTIAADLFWISSSEVAIACASRVVDLRAWPIGRYAGGAQASEQPTRRRQMRRMKPRRVIPVDEYVLGPISIGACHELMKVVRLEGCTETKVVDRTLTRRKGDVSRERHSTNRRPTRARR